MSGAQRLVRIHDHVDFDDDARAAVIGPDGIDAGDHGGVRHCWFFEDVVRQVRWEIGGHEAGVEMVRRREKRKMISGIRVRKKRIEDRNEIKLKTRGEI